MTTFRQRVLAITTAIPAGKVMTYKEVAIAAGSPRAARAVGNILKQNFDPLIPCHRVIKSTGELGGYNRGAAQKALLLQQEQAIIS
jgi:methylated-DNA-[protein]-cysteine S-methyltransferase